MLVYNMIDYNRIFTDKSIGPLANCLQEYYDGLLTSKAEVEDRVEKISIQYKGALTLKEKIDTDPSQIVIRFQDEKGPGRLTPDMDKLLESANKVISQYEKDSLLLEDINSKLNLFSNTLQSSLNMLLAINESNNV